MMSAIENLDFEKSFFSAIIYFATERPQRLMIKFDWEFLRTFEYAAVTYLRGLNSKDHSYQTVKQFGLGGALIIYGDFIPRRIMTVLHGWIPRAESDDSTGEVGPVTPLLPLWQGLVCCCDNLGTGPRTWSVPDNERLCLLEEARKLDSEDLIHAAGIGINFQQGVNLEIKAFERRHLITDWNYHPEHYNFPEVAPQ